MSFVPCNAPATPVCSDGGGGSTVGSVASLVVATVGSDDGSTVSSRSETFGAFDAFDVFDAFLFSNGSIIFFFHLVVINIL